MSEMKEVLFHKLTIRIVAFSATFLSTKILLLLSNKTIHDVLVNVFVDPTLKPGADQYLRTALGLLMTVAGATAYHFIHEKWILPKVKDQAK